MVKKYGGIRIFSKVPCPIETINEFNKRIAEIISEKYSREFIEKVINEYDEKKEVMGN